MPPSSESVSSSEIASGTVPNSLTSLIPTFDPSVDSVEVWSQKVELLSKVWPSDKITELITRLILSCKGSAFQKLQIKQQELLKNDLKCVKQVVELVGGQFGQVPLEKKYEAAERALFRSLQKADESNDSFLARTDVAWSELLSQQPQIRLEELQAYITLRGSQLSAEDKKRVLIEAGAENGGVLTMQKVTAAIRLLGAGFFQDYTGTKKAKLKTYDQTAFLAEEDADHDQDLYYTMDEENDEEFLDQLAQEGDEDAILVAEYEAAMSDTVQDDKELATALTAYQDARRRLSERFRNRGFWPVKPSKGKGKGKFSSKGKGSGFGKGRKSLQDRILNSRCRLCGKMGHWKAECPERGSNNSIGSSSSVSASMVSGASTMYASSMNAGVDEMLGLEFLQLPQVQEETPLDESRTHECCFGVLSVRQALKGIKERVWGRNTLKHWEPQTYPRNDDHKVVATSESINSVDILFVSHGCSGVVDLGASKTVIGSEHLSELIQSLDQTTRSQLQRCPCHMHFRFGNQGVLSSSQALIVPIGQAKVKIAIVPGKTPFLISNSLLRGLQAVIDTHHRCLRSPFLKQAVKLTLTPRGLFLMDLNDLIVAARNPGGNMRSQDIFVAEDSVSTSEKLARAEPQSDQQESCEQTRVGEPRSTSHTHRSSQTCMWKGSPIRQVIQQPPGVFSHPEELKRFHRVTHRIVSFQMSTDSLAARLAKVQVKVEVPLPDITKYELSELENMTVQFGTTHVGKKFSTMWKEEQGWISWFVPRYNKSEKMDHRLMIRYIDLKVQEAENWNHKVPVTPSPKDVMKNKPMPKSLMQSKSKAKPGNKGYQMSMEDMDKETREEIEEIERAQWEALETGEDWDLHEMLRAGEPTRQDCLEADVQCLQTRLLSMENMLQQVVNHIQATASSEGATK